MFLPPLSVFTQCFPCAPGIPHAEHWFLHRSMNEMLSVLPQKYSGGQHFTTLTAAHFSYFFVRIFSASSQSRIYPAASSSLIPAKNCLTQNGTSPCGVSWITASTLIPSLRANNATVSSLGVVFPFSISEIDRSVFPSSSARPTCVRPSLRRASDTAAPKSLFKSRIDSPFTILI